MLKRAILWLIPLVVLAIFAVCLIVLPAFSSHAASVGRPPVAGSTTTPTPTSGDSPDVMWNGQ